MLLWVFLLLAGCGFQKDPQEFNSTITTSESTPTILPDGDYPANPEGVVHAFMVLFPQDPGSAIQYLSPQLVAGLDENTLLNLLQIPGTVDGYMMLEGSGSAAAEYSQIKIAISSNQQTYLRLFDLTIQNGLWQINNISIP